MLPRSSFRAKGAHPITPLGSELHGVSLEIVKDVSHGDPIRFLVFLYDETTEELCSCDMSMGEEPNVVYVNGGACKIVAAINPVMNTQVFADEQYIMQAPFPCAAFDVHLPRVRPESEYVVDFILFHGNEPCSTVSRTLHNEGPAVQHPLHKIQYSGVLALRSSWNVISYFEDLSDNGFSERFTRDKARLETFVQVNPRYEDLLALVMLTECDSLLLRGKIDAAILVAKQARHISSAYSCCNDRFIQAYAHVAFAARHRFHGHFDEAKEELDSAAVIFQLLEPSEYSCAFNYNIVAYMMAKAATREGLTAREQQTSEDAFHRALEHWDRQTQIRNDRRPQRIYNRQISRLMHSSMTTAPEPGRNVSPENLDQAKKKLEYFKNNLLDSCPAWPRILFYLNRSDYCIITGNVCEAYAACSRALSIAKKHGFEREAGGASVRLRTLEDARRTRQLPIPENSATAEVTPCQYPIGPPESYDFMQHLAASPTEQNPVGEETGDSGQRRPAPRVPTEHEDMATGDSQPGRHFQPGGDICQVDIRATEFWLLANGAPEEIPRDASEDRQVDMAISR